MQKLTTDELRKMRDRRDDFLLINVLDEESFDKEHIPDSRSLPLERKDFLKEVNRLAGRKDRRIVVYCAGPDCTASPTAGKKLEADGFTNISHYEGGMKAWREAGLPIRQAAHVSH